jgi:hypothetical protein
VALGDQRMGSDFMSGLISEQVFVAQSKAGDHAASIELIRQSSL